MSIADDLIKLKKLLDSDAITNEEFENIKKGILSNVTSIDVTPPPLQAQPQYVAPTSHSPSYVTKENSEKPPVNKKAVVVVIVAAVAVVIALFIIKSYNDEVNAADRYRELQSEKDRIQSILDDDNVNGGINIESDNQNNPIEEEMTPVPDKGQTDYYLSPEEEAWSAGYEDGYIGVQPDRNSLQYVNYIDYFLEGWEYGYNDSVMGNSNQNPFR